uniref:SRCR domain-containing protein n=1 Tax=Gopherus evgoodei TaxID=1825980 RepID=A0A8C4WP58_9SAUR
VTPPRVVQVRGRIRTRVLCDGNIRLVSGADPCRGRVEIFYQGTWGTVCDDDWGMSDTSVVCRQVGCGRAVAHKSNAYFGYGTGRILLDNVNCEGSEPRLSACYSLGWGIHNCGHHEDAGVICTGKGPNTQAPSKASQIWDHPWGGKVSLGRACHQQPTSTCLGPQGVPSEFLQPPWVCRVTWEPGFQPNEQFRVWEGLWAGTGGWHWGAGGGGEGSGWRCGL